MATHEVSLLQDMDVVYVVDQGTVTKISDQAKLTEYIDSLSKSNQESQDFRLI